MSAPFRVVVFGTYDAARHPRVATLIEGLRAHGVETVECNVPSGLGTAARVAALTQPWRVPLVAARIAGCWLRLARAARRVPEPDAVLVGYLGHFDVHLARLLFRRVPVALDHLIGAADTARDRRVRDGLRYRLLRRVDAAALAAADAIIVDTAEHLAALPSRCRSRGMVVPVGASAAWFAAAQAADAQAADVQAADVQAADVQAADVRRDPDRLRVVFFGLYTPLQGAPVIGRALARIAGAPISVTMVGGGQDEVETRRAAAGNPDVRWLDWVDPADLPALVAAHDVCLGIFGTGGKARRVVPNKVYQGAAAGCAVITSDTGPQRRALGEAALLVPPGDPEALAEALLKLAAQPDELRRLRAAAADLAGHRFTAGRVVTPLVDRLRAGDAGPGAAR